MLFLKCYADFTHASEFIIFSKVNHFFFINKRLNHHEISKTTEMIDYSKNSL